MGPDMNELEVEQIEERLRKSAIGHRPAAPSELLRFVDAVPVENRFAGRPTLIGHPHVRRSFAALATAAAVVVGLVSGVALVSLRTGGTAVSGGPDAAAAGNTSQHAAPQSGDDGFDGLGPDSAMPFRRLVKQQDPHRVNQVARQFFPRAATMRADEIDLELVQGRGRDSRGFQRPHPRRDAVDGLVG